MANAKTRRRERRARERTASTITGQPVARVGRGHRREVIVFEGMPGADGPISAQALRGAGDGEILRVDRDQRWGQWFDVDYRGVQPPPAYPMPASYDDASLLIDCDRLEEIGSPLAEVLRRLPTKRHRQVGEIVNTLEWAPFLRCIGGEYNNTFAMEGLPARAATRTEAPWDTHHYVEHSAVWNGLTLRWYEWEDRTLPDKMRALLWSGDKDKAAVGARYFAEVGVRNPFEPPIAMSGQDPNNWDLSGPLAQWRGPHAQP